MALPNIEEAIYREMQQDIMTWMYCNHNKHDVGGTDMAWHSARNDFVEFMVDRGWCKHEGGE